MRHDLKRFLTELASKPGIDNIVVIAHSMGNRTLTALNDVMRDNAEARAKVKHVILAAPDIDTSVFEREVAPALTQHVKAATLYASSSDWALTASKFFHGYPRAGDARSQMTIVPGISTIDTSSVLRDAAGHSYFSQAPEVLDDINAIMGGRASPGERTNLSPLEAASGRYWKLKSEQPEEEDDPAETIVPDVPVASPSSQPAQP